MTYTAQDEQTSPFAPVAGASARRPPMLPEPPQFASSTDVAATREQRVGHQIAPQLGEVDAPTMPVPAASGHPDESIYRAHSVATPSDADPTPEQRHLAAERAARREARTQALAAPDIRTVAAVEPIVVTRRSNDRFLGAVSLFLLRLVVAAIMAVRGLEIVTNLPAAEALFATTIIPEPRIMALVAGVSALAIAVALVFGLLTRVAGLGVTLITGGALAFVLWGNWSPFLPGRSGFIGEFELLLAAVGLLFLCVGGGGFSLDRSFRKSREKDRPLQQVS